MQMIYFKKHSLNKKRNVQLDVDKMYKDNYENEMFRLMRLVTNNSKHQGPVVRKRISANPD